MDNLSALVPNCLLAFNASMFAYDPSPYTSWGIAISAFLWIAAHFVAKSGGKGAKEEEVRVSSRLHALEKAAGHTNSELEYMRKKIDSIATALQMQQLGRL